MKIRMNRFLSGIVFALSLSVFSCGNLSAVNEQSVGNKQTAEGDCPTIRLSLGNVSSRTAMPNVDPDEITIYTLIGKFGSDEAINQVWESDEEGLQNGKTAYAKLREAELPVKAGGWTFTLTGSCKNENVIYATYTDTLAKTIGSGRNELEFALMLVEDSLNLGNDGGFGTLDISIDFQVENRVKRVTAKLVKASDKSVVSSESHILTEDTNFDNFVDVKKYHYTVEDVPAGSYIAYINFYAGPNPQDLLGTYPEAVNINALGAESEIRIDNLEAVYTSTFYYVDIDGETTPTFGAFEDAAGKVNLMELNGLPYNFTRYSEYTLKEPVRTGYHFWKWIQINASDAETTTSLDAIMEKGAVTGFSKRTVGNKHFAAVFVKQDYAKNLDALTFANYYDDATVGKAVTAQISGSYKRKTLKWIWRYNNGGAYTDLSSKTEHSTSSSYVIPPKNAGVLLVGKTLEAWVLPDYRFETETFTYDGNEYKKISSVKKYSVSDSTDSDYVKLLSDTAVKPGTLKLGNAEFKYTATELRGASLSNKFAFKDDSAGIRDNGERFEAYKSEVTISYAGSLTAPLTSSALVENIPLTFSVDGYNDLEETVPVFINVKYAAPPTGADGEIEIPSLIKMPYTITYNKMKFASASSDVEYRVGEGSWQTISSDEFASGIVQIRYKQRGTKDTAGYVEASDAYTLNSENAVGKKVLLSKVEYDTSSFVVGGTIKVKASPDFTDTPGINFVAEGYGYIDWNYKADGTTIFTDTDNAHSTTSQFTVTDAVRSTWYNKSITVEALYHYQADEGTSTVSKTTEGKTIEKGTISKDSITLTYSEVWDAGRALDTSKLEIAVSGIAGPYSAAFEDGSSAAKSTSGETYYVRISVPCYNDVSQVPFIVNVKTPAPTAAQISALLSTENTVIPRGEIRFADNAPTGLEWSYTNDGSSVWKDVVATETYKTSADSAFEENDVIYVRFKAKPGVSPSDIREVIIGTDNIGTRALQITFTVLADDKLIISAGSETVSVSGNKSGSAVRWYVDGVIVEGVTGQTLNLRNLPLSYMPVAGIYTVRAVSLNEFDEDISANATVTVSND